MTNLDTVKDLAQDMIDKLGVDGKVSVEEQESAPREDSGEERTVETFLVNIDGEDLGAVIGHHGETLNSLGHVLSLMASKQADTPIRVIVDAGDWRKGREEQLESMAKRAIDQVRRSGKDYMFPPMNANERRILHMIISEEANDLATESMGEGRTRHVVLKLK